MTSPNSAVRRRRSKKPVPDIPAPILVQTPQEFAEMMRHLRLHSLLAVDTESDSLFRYTPRVCLIQISTYASTDPGDVDPNDVVDYLVDPLNLSDLAPLGGLLADPEVEVILHAADNDVLVLQRDFDFHVTNIFDTQLAARILGRNGVGLAAMLEEEFGVVSDKSMQRTNWGRRPLTPQQMTYAQIDTHYLLVLRQRQIERLQKAGRWREAQEAFKALEQIQYVEPEEDRVFWSMKGTRDVEREQHGLLEELWLWREQTAQREEQPPFKIMRDQVLVELTQRAPTTLDELHQIRGLNDRMIRRYGREILAAVARGKRRPLPPLPKPRPRPEQLLDKREQNLFNALRSWRSQTASERGVDPDIVFSNDILLQIVDAKPRSVAELAEVPAVGPWKAETYGPAILRLVQKHA